jgi:hypothetical protein
LLIKTGAGVGDGPLSLSASETETAVQKTVAYHYLANHREYSSAAACAYATVRTYQYRPALYPPKSPERILILVSLEIVMPDQTIDQGQTAVHNRLPGFRAS